MNYDVSKLKFDIVITYSCDEGEGRGCIIGGTYDEAVDLFWQMDRSTYIDCFYHTMFVHEFTIYDENGKELDMTKVLDGKYDWIPDYCETDKSEATEFPSECLEFLDELKG